MSLLVYRATLFLFSCSLIVFWVSSSTIEVIRHSGSPPSADAFSNPGCHVSYCQEQSTHCYRQSCCECQCQSITPNYIVSKWICVSREELNQMNSTRCAYSIRKPSEPLEALPLTEQMVGNGVRFTDTDDHRTLITCNEELKVSKWEYRNAFGEWKIGEGDVFTLQSYIKGGPARDQRVLEYLKWSGKLESKYAGTLIKVTLKCGEQEMGCFLSKIKGSHTYNTTRLPTVRPPPVITQTTTSIPTTTDISTTTSGNIQTNTNAYQKDKEGQSSTNTGDAAAIFGPILGVLALVCLIALISVVALRYRRRRRRRQRDDENNSVAKLEEYQEPIYADINKGDFDNPLYNDPALNPAFIKAHLGPLPKIPGSESAYQPLDSLTRSFEEKNYSDYDNPPTDAKPELDYDNPPVGEQDTNDYDNPPVRGGEENTGEYDNPPVNDGVQNTGDYDNPPVNSEMNSTEDYDNPPVNNADSADDDVARPDTNHDSDSDDNTYF